MTNFFKYKASIGTFYIAEHEHKGCVAALFENDALGFYSNPQKAAEALAKGIALIGVFKGFETANLGIPADVGAWTCCAALGGAA
jgi:hypothetical protein